jgi:uncharacterized NAD(P)/FAD-binding protein YdhS
MKLAQTINDMREIYFTSNFMDRIASDIKCKKNQIKKMSINNQKLVRKILQNIERITYTRHEKAFYDDFKVKMKKEISNRIEYEMKRFQMEFERIQNDSSLDDDEKARKIKMLRHLSNHSYGTGLI